MLPGSGLLRTSDEVAFLLLQLQRSYRSRAAERCESRAHRLHFWFAIGTGCRRNTLVVVHKQVLLRIGVHALVSTRRDWWVGSAFVGS